MILQPLFFRQKAFLFYNNVTLPLLFAFITIKRINITICREGKSKVCIPTVFTAAPAVLKKFEETEYAAILKETGVITSYICPLMYMNNPLSEKMPVITSSNKLRTYTSARYYTDAEILEQITKGGAR